MRKIRSTPGRPTAIRTLFLKPKDPGPVPATTTTIKRIGNAWAWQVICEDGSDWRQGVRSSRADAENDARAAKGALEGGGPDLAP